MSFEHGMTGGSSIKLEDSVGILDDAIADLERSLDRTLILRRYRDLYLLSPFAVMIIGSVSLLPFFEGIDFTDPVAGSTFMILSSALGIIVIYLLMNTIRARREIQIQKFRLASKANSAKELSTMYSSWMEAEGVDQLTYTLIRYKIQRLRELIEEVSAQERVFFRD